MLFQRPQCGEVFVKCGFARNAFGDRLRHDFAAVLPARQARQAQPDTVIARHEIALVHVLQLSDGADAVATEFFLHRFADAVNRIYRQISQKGQRFCRADYRKPARFIEVGSNLGEKLIMAEANRHGDADILFNAVDQLHERLRGRAAMQTVGAAQI